MTYTKLDSTGKICYVWGSNTDGSNPFNIIGGTQLNTEHYLGNSDITTVYLLDSPTEYKIEQRAFQNCANLQIIKTVDQTMEIHPLYGNDSQILYNVSEFDWNCFDNIGSVINFEYQNLNMNRIIFWGQCFYKNKTFNNFKINTNKDKCSIIFSTQIFAGYKKTFDTIEIVAKSLQYEQMATLPTYLDSLIYLAEIENKLKLDINITNLNDIKEFINNKIFTNRATYGNNTPITMEFSFPNSLMYGVCDTDYASLPCYSTTKRLKILPGWTNIEIDNINPNIKESALQLIDLSELNNEQVNLDKYYLSKCIQSNIELTILLPSLQFYLNNVTPIQPVYKWSNLRLLVPNESGTGGFIAFDTISLDNKINIHDYAFYNCQQLINIIISSQVMSIGKGAFYGCVNVSNLKYDAINCKSFNIQSGNQIFAKLGQDTDNGCLVQIGPNVEKIPTAFMYPEALDIHDPNLGTYPKIQDIQICDENWKALSGNNKNTKLTTIGTAAFKYVNRSEWPANNWNLTTFFQHCNNLKILGSSAFAGVHSITELYLPDNLVEIGDNCFNECKKLNKIANTFPASLISIHPRAFGGAQSEDILYNFTWSENSGQAPNDWCNLLHCKHNYCTYLVYIVDGENQSWILHWFIGTSALDEEHLPSTIRYRYITLPENIYGVSRHGCYALDVQLPSKYLNGRNEYEIFGINKSAPQIIEDQAFLSTSYVKDEDISQYCSSVKMNLFDTRILGSESIVHLGIHSDARTTNIMIYHFKNTNINNIQIQQNALSLGSLYHTIFKYNRICGKIYFDKLSDLEYWLFNPNASINNGQLIYRKGWWTMSYCSGVDENENEIFTPITQFVMDSNGVKINNDNDLIINPTITKLNAYSLHNIEIYNWLIDLHHYDIKDSYLFGNNLCLQKDSSDLKFYHIQLINGYNTIETKNKYQNIKTIFTIDTTSNFEVKTLELPYYALANWFSNDVYCGSINTYIVYGGNIKEENDTQQSKLKIYNYNLTYLSLPLTSTSDSLNQPNNKILSSFSINIEGYDFSNLQTFKLTQPVNNQKTKYYLNQNSLQNATKLKYVELDYRLTNINSEVFLNSNNLEIIKLIGPDTLTLKDWYNITFDSITSSPFYSIEWNDNKDNCKLYINNTEYFKPIIQVGEKENYIIKNTNNEIEYIKYDPKPFYNYPILGLVFDQALDGTFNQQDIKQANSVSLLDITNTLQVIGFNALAPNMYSVDNNIFKVQNNKLPQYGQLKYIILDNAIKDIPRNCFNNFSHPLANGGIGLGKQVQTLGEDSFLNCVSYIGEYESVLDENLLTVINSWIIENDNEKILKDNGIIAADFNYLTLSNQCNLALCGNKNNIITLEIEGLSHKAIYYNNNKFNFLLRYEIQGSYNNKSIDLINNQHLRAIDLKAIKIQISSAYGGQILNSLTIPWLGTCGDTEYVPADQYSALKNWFDIEDTQMVNIDTLRIKNSEGLHGFNPIGTTTPVFQNININNLVIEAPNSKPIATNQQHFDSKNMNLNSIVLKMDEIPSYLLSNNENDLQQINKLHIQPYTTNNLTVAICDRALRTPIINEIIFMSQENLCGNSVFNDPLINDYIYYSASLRDWVRYNSFGNENSNPIRFARKFYTNYINEENKGGIERVLQPDSDEYNDGTNTWRRFYVNSYSLYNNHQVNTIICTHNNATENEKYTLYDSLSSTTLPKAPFRSTALIEVITDIYHDSIRGLVEKKDEQYEQGDIYASQCFKSGVTASEAISKEDA